MLVYTITLFATVFLVFITQKESSQAFLLLSKKHLIINKNILFVFLSYLIMVFVTGTRYNVGVDYFYTYVPIFNKILSGLNVDVEYGYYLLNKLVILFTDNYMWLFVVCSVIFFFFIYKYIFRDSPYPYLSIFLFITSTYFFVYMNAMRQMLAISIFLFSLKYIYTDEKIKYFISILFASMFHTSILICLPLIFMNRINIDLKKGCFLLAISFFLKKPLAILVNFTMNFLGYQNYMGSIFDNRDFSFLLLIINIGIFIFCSFFEKKFDIKYTVNYNLHFLSIFTIVLYDILPLAQRIRWIFNICLIVLIPISISTIKNSNVRKIFISLIVVCYLFYFIYTISIQNYNGVLPYQNILFV